MLHVFRLRRTPPGTPGRDGPTGINDTAVALSEACIQCARRSCSLLTESWIHGTFPTFDYTYTQYLFSAAIILAISSLSGNPESAGDADEFEAAAQILGQLEQNGSFAAREFCRHIEATKGIIEGIRAGRAAALGGDHRWQVMAVGEGAPYIGRDAVVEGAAEPSLQDLLSYSELDFEFLEPAVQGDGFQAFAWPVEGLGDWASG